MMCLRRGSRGYILCATDGDKTPNKQLARYVSIMPKGSDKMDHPMLWNELFPAEHEPLEDQIKEFVSTPLWDELADYMQQTYAVKPNLSYSNCSMDKGFWKGWNVKYKKSGKALCTLYPKRGYFMALIPVGTKEIVEADLLIPFCDAYTQNLYNTAKTGAIGKSQAVEVRSENILRDVKNLIALRVPTRKV